MEKVYRLIGIAALALVVGCDQTGSSTTPSIQSNNSLAETSKDFDTFCAELSEQMIKPFRSAMSIEKNIFELKTKVDRGEVSEKTFDLVAAQIDVKKAEHKYWGERWNDSGCVNRLPVGNPQLVLSK